jgi:hypothetical protein
MTARVLPPGPALGGYGAGLVLSVAAHAGALALLIAVMHPHAVPDQPVPKSALRIETQAVAQSQARAQDSAGEKATSPKAQGQTAAQGVVKTSTAMPAALPQTTAKAEPPPATALPQAAPPAVTKASVAPAQNLAAAAPPPVTAAETPAAPLTAAASAEGALAQSTTPQAETLAPAAATGQAMTATLAWSGAGGTIDPVSLKAIASFMRPGDAAAQADEVHDGLQSLLNAAPCSRLQAEFNPATGSLELRGHVPDPAMKAPLLAALQAQLGAGIKVEDAMMILPRPQCGALSGIADVGLPQSQDQLTNPRLIGADAQARTFSYTQGQTMVLDLAAPDYDAYVYVDFFDAGGNVIHLVPNQTVPLKLRPAKSALHVGAPDAGEPFLHITIGPPYGQEIAAAFAASAPLYDGDRPLSEPAAPYLVWLKSRVAEARAKDPSFKGEWVYFMVATQPK